MGQLDRMIAGCALLVACSKQAPREQDVTPPRAIPRAKAALRQDAPDPRFDAEGRLKPSSLKLSWFEIPMGFTRLSGSTERRAYYEAEGLTVEQLRAYVDMRAIPSRVEPRPRGEAYRNVKPTHTQLPVAGLDVTVVELDALDGKQPRIHLSIQDLASEGPQLSDAEAAAKLAKARARME